MSDLFELLEYFTAKFFTTIRTKGHGSISPFVQKIKVNSKTEVLEFFKNQLLRPDNFVHDTKTRDRNEGNEYGRERIGNADREMQKCV